MIVTLVTLVSVVPLVTLVKEKDDAFIHTYYR